MNEDHQDAMLLMVRHRAELEPSAARMIQVDRYGFTMEVTAPEGVRRVRLGFEEAVSGSDEVRKAMVRLVRQARAAVDV